MEQTAGITAGRTDRKHREFAGRVEKLLRTDFSDGWSVSVKKPGTISGSWQDLERFQLTAREDGGWNLTCVRVSVDILAVVASCIREPEAEPEKQAS